MRTPSNAADAPRDARVGVALCVPVFEVLVMKPDGTDVLVAATVDLRAPELPTVDLQPVDGRFGDVDTGVAHPGTALMVHRDPGAMVTQRAAKLLVLHLHNAAGDRVQLVRVRGPGMLPLLEPIVVPIAPLGGAGHAIRRK